LHFFSATALKAQATTIRERRETSECFNRNEGNGQLSPLGLRLAILKTPALANLANPISRALRTAPIPATQGLGHKRLRNDLKTFFHEVRCSLPQFLFALPAIINIGARGTPTSKPPLGVRQRVVANQKPTVLAVLPTHSHFTFPCSRESVSITSLLVRPV
jgi:hypothetical protein